MKWIIAFACLSLAQPALAQSSDPESAEPQDLLVEIYRIAPGEHRNFLEAIAQYDEVNRRASLPPRKLYVHQSGANWDFMLIQPARTPDDRRDALAAAWEEAGLPSGPDFFFAFRLMIQDHTDTHVNGPTTAADYLAKASQ